MACEAKQTAQGEVETVIAATLTAQPTPNVQHMVETACAATQTVMAPLTEPTTEPLTKTAAFISFHGRYITAMGEEDGWALGQERELGDCGWFTQYHLQDGKIALLTCHNRYVTAPVANVPDLGWVVRQEPELVDCGKFILRDLGHDRVAFESCIESFFTAADDSWDPRWHWLIIAQTRNLDTWEMFAVVHP
jgi:hypothetical protein